MKLDFRLDKWDALLLISMYLAIAIFIIPGLDAGYHNFKRSVYAFNIDMIVAIPLVIINVRYLMPYFFVKNRVWWYFPVLVLITAPLIFEYNALVKIFYSSEPDVLKQHGYKMGRIGLFIWSTLRHTTIMSLALVVRRLVFARQSIEELENEKKAMELNLLKSQLNPHFYFNTLNNLYALTLKKSDKAPEMILHLSNMMEFVIYDCEKDYILLEKETKFLENYIELERIRFDSSVDIKYEIIGNITSIQIIPMLFIQFVENAFKHGLSDNPQGYIKIRFEISHNEIIFTCENSFIRQISKPGIGLSNTKSRLESYYQGKYDLKINDENGIYFVSLRIKYA
jgi:hypothetical protein